MAIFFLPLLLAAAVAAEEAPPVELKQLSLEQLMNVEIVSAARKPQAVNQTPGAVYVITADDIRRSGATSIAEALRLAPGVNVARLNSSQWAVSIRGFQTIFADKVLILIDGRTQNSTIFNGVLWDSQDVFLEDIDRIEVVRGPGCALWGPDAVNGVINIITKAAQDTQGFLTYAGGGMQERGFGGARFGGKLGSSASYRVYGKYFDRGPQPLAHGSPGSDEWHVGRGGFRADWNASSQDKLLLQGDSFRGSVGDSITEPDLTSPTLRKTASGLGTLSGGDVQGRWQHTYSSDSDLALQLYYDRIAAQVLGATAATEDYFDLDFQRHQPLGERHDIVWGLGYRANKVAATDLGTLSIGQGTSNLYTLFVQDEIVLVLDKLHLIIGSKFDHNDFSGWEVQPRGKLLWLAKDRQTVWAAVSRALRTPSRNDQDIALDIAAVPPGQLVRLVPNPNFKDEEVLSYELGYRVQPREQLTLDAAAFYNVYHGEDTILQAGPANPGPPPFVPVASENARSGHTWGTELSAVWQALPWWRWQASYSFLEMSFPLDPVGVENLVGDSPRNQLTARSLMNLTRRVELDATARYVDNLPDLGVPSYLTADARIGWRPSRNWEISVAGRNLAGPKHLEFVPQFILSQPTMVPRSVYGKVTWSF